MSSFSVWEEGSRGKVVVIVAKDEKEAAAKWIRSEWNYPRERKALIEGVTLIVTDKDGNYWDVEVRAEEQTIFHVESDFSATGNAGALEDIVEDIHGHIVYVHVGGKTWHVEWAPDEENELDGWWWIHDQFGRPLSQQCNELWPGFLEVIDTSPHFRTYAEALAEVHRLAGVEKRTNPTPSEVLG